MALEGIELVPRGLAYVDGLAKSFEARNYIVLLSALTTSTTILLLPLDLLGKLVSGVLLGFLVKQGIFLLSRDDTIGDIAEVRVVPLTFQDYSLYVEDMYLTNIGLSKEREWVLENCLGIVITPKGVRSSITLANKGTRQAIIHEIGRVLGMRRFFTTQRDVNTGRVGILVDLVYSEEEALLRVIRNVPLLESIRRKDLA